MRFFLFFILSNIFSVSILFSQNSSKFKNNDSLIKVSKVPRYIKRYINKSTDSTILYKKNNRLTTKTKKGNLYKTNDFFFLQYNYYSSSFSQMRLIIFEIKEKSVTNYTVLQAVCFYNNIDELKYCLRNDGYTYLSGNKSTKSKVLNYLFE